MNEEAFVRLISSQTQALTQVAMVSNSTKEVLEKVVDNQTLQTELLQKMTAAHEEFRNRTFNVLCLIAVFLVLVIAGLMYRLNIKGAGAISDAAKSITSGNPLIP